MADTAIADPDAGLSLAQLAERHGLRVSGERPGLLNYTRQLWSYRHFIGTFSNAGLVASFNGARLGRIWQVLTPLTNAAVYYLIFGIVLDTKRGIPNFIAYLCTGMFVYTFTAQVMMQGVQAVTRNLGLIRALHFPRASLPLAVTLTQFQNLGASMVVLAGIVLATGEPVTLRWILVIPALIFQAVFNAGMAMIFARLGNKITDIKQLLPFLMRTWMYSSGVMYSVTAFAQHLPHRVAQVVEVNPLVVYIQLVRHSLLHSLNTKAGRKAMPLTMPMHELWMYGLGWALVIGIGGYIFFWHGEQEYGRG